MSPITETIASRNFHPIVLPHRVGFGGDRGWPVLPDPGESQCDRNGFVYVIDTGLLCVKKFTNNGTFVTKWGERGSQNGQFLKPFDVVIDEDGYIYITDSSDESVQKFTADGVFLSKWETSRKEPDRITEQSVFNIFDLMNSSFWKTTTTKPVLPNSVKRTLKSIVLDSADNIYIADNREMIWKFSPSGNLITYWGSASYGEGQFQGLESIAVDRGNFIYSVEQSNNQSRNFLLTVNTSHTGIFFREINGPAT